jgi:hypothetical protein
MFGNIEDTRVWCDHPEQQQNTMAACHGWTTSFGFVPRLYLSIQQPSESILFKNHPSPGIASHPIRVEHSAFYAPYKC